MTDTNDTPPTSEPPAIPIEIEVRNLVSHLMSLLPATRRALTAMYARELAVGRE